jgi:hypothetical protein
MYVHISVSWFKEKTLDSILEHMIYIFLKQKYN